MKMPSVNIPLFIFLCLAGVMATGLVCLAMVFLALSIDIPEPDMARVYLPQSKQTITDKNPDRMRLVVNIVHEMPGDKDCPKLKYKWGVLKQPCQIPEHWKIVIKRREVTKEELLKALIVEGDIDRPGGTGTPSGRTMLIRADSSASFEMVKEVIKTAGRALIWKIEIGATKPPEY